MSNLLTVIQNIAVNAVRATIPVQYCYGTITNDNPLSIRINDGTIEITGESILLTEPVVEKKITIQKHTHKIGSTLAGHKHMFTYTDTGTPVTSTTNPSTDINTDTTIIDTILDAVCTEHGVDLPTDSNSERIVITTNRALEKDDKVLMMRVSAGQKFIVLSRIFDHE